jgi:hypothetical protein
MAKIWLGRRCNKDQMIRPYSFLVMKHVYTLIQFYCALSCLCLQWSLYSRIQAKMQQLDNEFPMILITQLSHFSDIAQWVAKAIIQIH